MHVDVALAARPWMVPRNLISAISAQAPNGGPQCGNSAVLSGIGTLSIVIEELMLGSKAARIPGKARITNSHQVRCIT
jgi:hypothetical protein